MRILEDGRVEIKGKKTGNIKIVQPEELGSYGIPYSTYETELKAFKNIGGKTKAKVSEEKKELTEGERTKRNLAITGLSNLQQAKDEYRRDPSVVNKQAIPLAPLSREYDSTLFNSVDPLLRIRTGATAPENETRRYMRALGGFIGDSPEIVRKKFERLQEALITEGGLTKEEAKKIMEGAAKKKPQQSQKSPQQNQQAPQKQPLNMQSATPGLEFLSPQANSQSKPQRNTLEGLPETLQGVLRNPLVGQAARATATTIAPQFQGAGIYDDISNVPMLGDILTPRYKGVKQKLASGQLPTPSEVVGLAAETGLNAASLPPGGQGLQASKIPMLMKALGLGGKLAAPGTIYGATDPTAESLQERGQKALAGGAGSLLTAGLLRTPNAVTGAVRGKATDRIMEVFNPLESQLNKFRRNTGLDFADEVIKRDLKEIAGKNTGEVLDYYNSKVEDLSNAADNFLASTGKTIKRDVLVTEAEKFLSKLTPQQGRILQGSGRQAIQELIEDLKQAPKEIALDIANQFKRDAATQGRAAFGPSGSSSAATNALASFQSKVDELISGQAKGIKDINKTVQFYRIARDSIQKKADQEAKKSGGFLGPAVAAMAGSAGGTALSAVTGNPLIALLGLGVGGGIGAARHIRGQTGAKTSMARKSLQNNRYLPEPLRKYLELQGGKVGSSL